MSTVAIPLSLVGGGLKASESKDIGQAHCENRREQMTIPEVKRKAREIGVRPGRLKKSELIRAIQTAEGNMACYGTAKGGCPNADCCFMVDCLRASS